MRLENPVKIERTNGPGPATREKNGKDHPKKVIAKMLDFNEKISIIKAYRQTKDVSVHSKLVSAKRRAEQNSAYI